MFLTKIRQFFDKIGDKKILKKIPALGMGALMLLPGTISANQNDSKNESESAKKAENNKFSDELKTDVGKNSNILYEKDKKENKDTAETVVHIIAPAQSKYTEVSDGRENNENIQEVLSTRSVDGKSIYGWMLASEIEYKTQHKEINVQKIMLTR